MADNKSTLHDAELPGPGFASGWRALSSVGRAIEGAADPIGMAMPLMHAQLAWFAHPLELSKAMMRLADLGWRLQTHAIRRSLGAAGEDPITPHQDDARFSDPVWRDSAYWDLLKESYLMLTRTVQDMLYETPGMSSRERRRAAFWWRAWLNAVAPTNFLFSNPVALRKTVETRGENLLQGFQNFVADVEHGSVRMTDPDSFKVGENLATTPGVVVFRNHLVELIHYRPTQARVHSEPLLIVTPWINKYYVLDLDERKSMIRYLLDQGVDVYITSWKNPDESMRDTAFEDYLVDGIDACVSVARQISGASKAHAAGYCIGGTALTCYMAWANRHYPKGRVPVRDFTLFTTLVDFHKPGDIEVFIDEESIRYLCDGMERKGYLDGKEMAASFRLLRSNSLIWHYVVHGWLYGESPPAFDLLFWNMDTTRMPYAMHAWYLHEFYLHNRLIRPDGVTLAGHGIDLGKISQAVYAVGAEDDHIAPWKQTFRVMNLVSGERRYVLSSSGHILGIVNPPRNPPKRNYVCGDAQPSDSPGAWYHRAEADSGTWWEDWMQWLKPRCGPLRDAPTLDSESHPALEDAPGSYVLEP